MRPLATAKQVGNLKKTDLDNAPPVATQLAIEPIAKKGGHQLVQRHTLADAEVAIHVRLSHAQIPLGHDPIEETRPMDLECHGSGQWSTVITPGPRNHRAPLEPKDDAGIAEMSVEEIDEHAARPRQ